MSDEVSAVSVDVLTTRTFRGEAEWRALMAGFDLWDGSAVSFCEARGVPRKTFQDWRRRLGLAAGKPRGKPGDGVVLRLRRS